VHNTLDFVSKHCRFYNCYECTECTGAAIQHMITRNNDDFGILPIGRPMTNVHIYILDQYLQPTIPGVQTGEIVIGGNI
jgi:non-ribosomal peptide synthetase component F